MSQNRNLDSTFPKGNVDFGYLYLTLFWIFFFFLLFDFTFFAALITFFSQHALVLLPAALSGAVCKLAVMTRSWTYARRPQGN